MSDVDRMLSPGEQVAYRARLHWIIFGPPLIFFAGGLVSIPFHTIAAIGLLLVSIVAIFDAYVKFSTTEIVITNRRVIYKVGFFSRRTIEMNKDKIEFDRRLPVRARPPSGVRHRDGEGHRRRHRGDPQRGGAFRAPQPRRGAGHRDALDGATGRAAEGLSAPHLWKQQRRPASHRRLPKSLHGFSKAGDFLRPGDPQ